MAATAACEEVRKSKRFGKLLEIILLIGGSAFRLLPPASCLLLPASYLLPPAPFPCSSKSPGNIMNTGSRNAESVGFDISYLPKLSNTKDRDNKSTLLHFLVETVEKNHPELLSFYVRVVIIILNRLLCCIHNLLDMKTFSSTLIAIFRMT